LEGSDLKDMGVSKNRGTPKSSILIGFSIINHPFLGTPDFWKHLYTFSNWRDQQKIDAKNVMVLLREMLLTKSAIVYPLVSIEYKFMYSIHSGTKPAANQIPDGVAFISLSAPA